MHQKRAMALHQGAVKSVAGADADRGYAHGAGYRVFKAITHIFSGAKFRHVGDKSTPGHGLSYVKGIRDHR